MKILITSQGIDGEILSATFEPFANENNSGIWIKVPDDFKFIPEKRYFLIDGCIQEKVQTHEQEPAETHTLTDSERLSILEEITLALIMGESI